MVLPNFIIAGAMKSGTTTLQEQLSKHPEVFIPKKIKIGPTTIDREVHFFYSNKIHKDGHWDAGLEWYEKLFEEWNVEKAIGEKTPKYLHIPTVPENIKKIIPNVMSIVGIKIISSAIDFSKNLYCFI